MGWGTPGKDMGPVEVLWDGGGVPLPGVNRHACENSAFPILQMRAVKMINAQTVALKIDYVPS